MPSVYMPIEPGESHSINHGTNPRIKPTEGKRKSEVVTVRLDPKLKYMSELAARRLRRTLSSYIEWVMEDALSRVHLSSETNRELTDPTIADSVSELWDVDEPDRFAKLALNYPELLDHEEQRIWKLVCECGYLWRNPYKNPHISTELKWDIDPHNLIFERLREHWPTFKAVVRGEKGAFTLPSWDNTRPSSKK
jgi:hypothetical protein